MSAKPIIRNKVSTASKTNVFGIETTRTCINLINIYSDENPIIDDNEECYFLMFNTLDFHRPIVAKGTVLTKTYLNNMNVIYEMLLKEIVEDEDVIYDYVLGDVSFAYNTVEIENKTSRTSKSIYFHRERDLEKFIERCSNKECYIATQAFFVRKDYKEILNLRLDYIEFIKGELNRQISEIDKLIELDKEIIK